MSIHWGGRGAGHVSRWSTSAASGPAVALDFLSGTLDPRITFTRASTATFVGSNGFIQSSAINAPRFDYNPSTLAAKGLLIEESRANMYTYSEQMNDPAWTKTGLTVTPDAIMAPTGSVTADALFETSAAGSVHRITQGPTTTAAPYTVSVYVKYLGRDWLYIRITDSGNVQRYAYFNISTGVLGTLGTGVTASITAVGNGFYRCTATIALAFAGAQSVVISPTIADSVITYDGDITKGVYAWGAQLEAGAFATSYIPTLSIPVTRSVDVASMTGTNFSSWYNQTEGSFTLQWMPYAIGPTFIIGQVSDGTASNRYIFRSANENQAAVDLGGVSQASLDAGSPTALAVNKSAFGYKLNDCALSLAGSAVVTDTSVTLPTVSQFNLGSNASPGGFINGHLRLITYYKTRLSDSQLQTLTQ